MLLGEHQLKNAATAIDTVCILSDMGYEINEEAIKSGLLSAHWPGRLEILQHKPVLIIDGAHNEEAAIALSNSLKSYFPDKKIIFIMGVLKDKNYKPMVDTVMPLADSFITVTPNSERALSAVELAIYIRDYCKKVQISDKIEEAVLKSLQMADKDSIICAFGSLHYIGDIRKYITKSTG